MTQKPFAEVIESSLQTWVAQSWQWDSFPPFGSLVTVQNDNRLIIGVIYQIQTGSIDTSRSPFAYQKTEQELRQQQPQIFEFLKTTLACLTLGYQESEILYYQIAPRPPKIHAFVQQASPDLYKIFFSNPTYLHLLFGQMTISVTLDELLLAMIKNAMTHQLLTPPMLHQIAQTLSLLTGNDYRRLKVFLQRAQEFVLQ
jgi:hypothetical protein